MSRIVKIEVVDVDSGVNESVRMSLDTVLELNIGDVVKSLNATIDAVVEPVDEMRQNEINLLGAFVMTIENSLSKDLIKDGALDRVLDEIEDRLVKLGAEG